MPGLCYRAKHPGHAQNKSNDEPRLSGCLVSTTEPGILATPKSQQCDETFGLNNQHSLNVISK